MPMVWLYVFLQDFLIPFLCDPDLQCRALILILVPEECFGAMGRRIRPNNKLLIRGLERDVVYLG